jgi:hypothetical protein
VAPVAHDADGGLFGEPPADPATGQGSPQLGRYEECRHAARRQQLHAAFDEGGGEVGLRGEPGAGAGPDGAGPPRGVSHGSVLRAQAHAVGQGQCVRSHPRWIPDDDGEATTCGDVAEARREAKGEGAAECQGAVLCGHFACASTEVGEVLRVLPSAAAAFSEEIAGAEGVDHGASFRANRVGKAITFCDGAMAFLAIKGGGERVFSGAGGSGVALAQLRHAFRARRRVTEVSAGERVADPDVVIQVRQWWDVGDPRFRALDDDGEPESQFAEPDGHRVAIDPEDAFRQDIAANHVEWAEVSGARFDAGECFEGVYEKRAGAAGGVEQSQGLEGLARVGGEGQRVSCVVECVRRQGGDRGEQRVAHDGVDE